jgi:hypothetical protein
MVRTSQDFFSHEIRLVVDPDRVCIAIARTLLSHTNARATIRSFEIALGIYSAFNCI